MITRFIIGKCTNDKCLNPVREQIAVTDSDGEDIRAYEELDNCRQGGYTCGCGSPINYVRGGENWEGCK